MLATSQSSTPENGFIASVECSLDVCKVAGHGGFTLANTSDGQRLLVKYLLSRYRFFRTKFAR